ncbi:MAG: hypothetical protein PHU12_04390 [Candidatus Aenigmarchaeota archaeon]|nr:hypothetical protein [Candidatus Aenigmarchaeota archaeon]
MKGLELPVNMLVVVAVAVIVLLGVVALFMTGLTPFGNVTGLQDAKSQGCSIVVTSGCSPNLNLENIAIDNFEGADNLYGLCHDYYGCDALDIDDEDDVIANTACCMKVCGC